TVQLDVACANGQVRTRVTAGRAPVITEVSDVCRRVLVGRSAADAVLRVRSVLQRRMRTTLVVDAEDHGCWTLPREVADLRVVAVDDERSCRVELANRTAPALGDVLELAVTVELVAEQVPEAERTRAQPIGDLGERGLVDLEQPELGIPYLEERRSDTGDEIRSGAIVRKPKPRTEDLRRHCRRGRLPVRRRDERRAEREPGGEPVDGTGIELPEHLPGGGRPAAGPGEP